MPGLVSTLFHHAYSMPLRDVQTFLHVTEQVWHPMHLSRFITIAICARTFMDASWALRRGSQIPPVGSKSDRWGACQVASAASGWSIQSTLSILRRITNSSRLEPTVP